MPTPGFSLRILVAGERCNITGEYFERGFTQRAKKVVSDSPGLVDFAIRLVNSVFNSNNRITVKSILLVKKFLGLVEM